MTNTELSWAHLNPCFTGTQSLSIANACLDRVSTPVIRTKPNPKSFRASVELEKVLTVTHWSELRTSEKEEILHRRLPELGITWDVTYEANGAIMFYKRTVKLVTLR